MPKPPPAPNRAEIVVWKAARRLRLTRADGTQRDFPVALGRNADADKQVEGDCATPLGDFYVCARNPRSRFFLSVCLSYPGAAHASRGLAAGIISSGEHAAILDALREGRMPPQKTRLGGEIYIHGEDPRRVASGAGPRDWTHGCIAVSNEAMQEIYDSALPGTPVRILP